jgi:predicted acylesterase/phospholipase RssA
MSTTNNRTLKLGFAMGGGVSLGSFSGAALSEVIRQAVLYGDYKTIEIDVFAGASAGSMSLAIMLRGLAYQTKAEVEAATTKLRSELKEKFDQLDENKKKDIIAAQVVQDLQYDIWVNEINIFKLLGLNEETKAEKEDLTFEAGLMRRNALIDIAQKFFNFKLAEENQENFTNKRLLGDRVLFASTLTNLTPIKVDARKTTPASDYNYTASEDAFTSYTHREVRVFDLNFKILTPGEIDDAGEFPGKWIRYHLGTKSDGAFGDLNTLAPWSKIVSTSIACGAFPFAFEPVVLKRYQYEYGDDWPSKLNGLGLQSDAGSSQYYPYTYVDGGTMNNEPVREAFRLASFQDAGDIRDFDRVIVFVDPYLGDENVDYRVAIHKQYFVQDPFQKWASALDGYDREKSPTLNRLLAHVGTMLSVLTQQVRNNENDKIHDTLEMFRDRKEYCNPVFDLIDHLPPAEVDAQLQQMTKKITDILKNERQNELLPIGAVTLKEELIRIRKEHLDHLDKISIPDIEVFCKDGKDLSPEIRKTILKAIYALLINILTGLAGKSSENKIIAIAPVIRDHTNKEERIFLPGAYLEAFSGFFSKAPNIYEVDLAKYCAREFMKRSGIVPQNANGDIAFPGKFAKQEEYEAEFRENLKYLKHRVENVIRHSKLLNLPLVEATVMPLIAKQINRKLDDIKLIQDPVDKFLFYIPVEDPDFEIDGIPHNSDATAIKEVLNGVPGFYIITELSYHWKDMEWRGAHVQPSSDFLIQKSGMIDSDICWIRLPERDIVANATLYPNPIFTLKNPITKADKGKKFPAPGWRIDPGIKPLEDFLLC